MYFIHFFELHHFWDCKKYCSWIVSALFLYFPSLVYSQPSTHLNSPSLSPIQKGELLLAQSLNKEALELYQSLIIAGNGDGYAFRGLVRAYQNMNKLEKAESWVQEFLLNDLDSSPALYALGYVNYLKNNFQKAEKLFNQAIKLNSNNTLALNNLGAVLAYQKLYTKAAEQVREAIRLNPKEGMFFYNLEAIYKKMNDPNLIIDDYNLYLKQGNSNLIRGYGMAVGRNMRQAGFKLYSQGRLDDAIQKFIEIEAVYKKILHEPGLVPVYFSLGLLHEEKGDLQVAKKYFNQVLTLNPLHIQAKERLKFF